MTSIEDFIYAALFWFFALFALEIFVVGLWGFILTARELLT